MSESSRKTQATSYKLGVRSRPVVAVSKCLLGERCRWDGEPVSAPAVLSLSNVVEFVPVCPETSIGLPVPRDPIRLVKTSRGIRLVQTRTGADLTAKMRSFCRRFLTGLRVDGFILKARSPSCAVRDATVHDDSGEVMEETRPGLFGAEILERFPGLPVEDEKRLEEPSVMLRFLGRLVDVSV
jgi:uncharacterized protein YbbK (DUF523 family)